MVCSHSTKNQLETRMDRLYTTPYHPTSTKCKESSVWIADKKPSTSYPDWNILYWTSNHWRSHNIKCNNPSRIPKALQNIQWSRVTTTSSPLCMGSCNRTLPNAPTTLPRRLLPLTQEEIWECHKFIQEHLQRGTITRSKSPYAANFFFVKKKDGKLWPVQDYWPLNKWTIWNRNVSPLILQSINWLSRCTLFTKFDVWWGYNNIYIKEDDEWKAVFLTPQGLFQPRVMFFSLTNSPMTFQTMVNMMFYDDIKAGYFTIYMDDGAIHTKPLPDKTHEEHLAWHQRYIHAIFDKLRKFDLYLKPEKCSFEQTEINFLGVMLRSWALGPYFSFFLVQYVLIRSHDPDSHDRLPVQQSHFIRNSIVPSFCTFSIVPFLW